MSEKNKKAKSNLRRRGIGLLLGLLPLLLLVASIIYGVTRGPHPKFVAIGWMIAAAALASINFFVHSSAHYS
jgi:hypothetical protein